MRRAGALLALVVLGSLPARARAWTCLEAACPVWCELPIHYQIGALPTGVDEAGAIAEVQRAFDDFEAVDCSVVAFVYDGRVPDTGATAPLVVQWRTDWSEPPSAINIANPMFPTGCIASATIDGNDVDFTWVTDAAAATGSAVDIYTLTAKGIGLAIGLGHSSVSGSLFYSAYTGGRVTLGADDLEGLCTIYGDGLGMCDPCLADAVCGAEGDLCVSYPDGRSYCGKACTAGGAECAADEECTDVGGGAMQCVRLMDGEQACVAPIPPGGRLTCAPCATSAECAGECLTYPAGASYCGSTCGSDTDCDTAAGEMCVAAGAVSACVRFVDGSPSCEGGAPMGDAGPPPGDAGGPGPDAGTGGGGGGGGGCAAVPSRRSSEAWSLLLLLGLAVWRRRRA